MLNLETKNEPWVSLTIRYSPDGEDPDGMSLRDAHPSLIWLTRAMRAGGTAGLSLEAMYIAGMSLAATALIGQADLDAPDAARDDEERRLLQATHQAMDALATHFLTRAGWSPQREARHLSMVRLRQATEALSRATGHLTDDLTEMAAKKKEPEPEKKESPCPSPDTST